MQNANQKAYKYRLNPTDAQAQRLRQMLAAPVLSGITPAETQRILEAGQKLPSAFELNKMLTGWKKLPDWRFYLMPTPTTFSRN